MSDKPITTDGKKDVGCFSSLLAVFTGALVSPYIVVIIMITNELMKAGLSFWDAFFKGIFWPITIVDFVVKIYVG